MRFDEFTFGTITFNQEKFIIQHLESIKFQVINYGKRYKTNLIIGDDCSKDNTLKLATEWARNNSNLFENIIIKSNIVNVGISNNFLYVINQIRTNKFHIIGGDDLYGPNSIYKSCLKDIINLSPTMNFNT